jgi:L-lactate dehydrogenase complex protein LldF
MSGEVAGRAPFGERYRAALADPDVRGGLIPFQEAWRATRDARIAEVEAITGDDFDTLRGELAAIKDAVRRDLPAYVARFRAAAEAAGAVVYEARTSADANTYIERLLRERGIDLVVKGKSMVSEELFLNEHLEAAGIRAVETDLGEWLIQLGHDHPSHLVMPAIHIRRQRAARILTEGTGIDLDPDDIPAMVRAARTGLRADFIRAGAGLTGANALIAESGTVMIVTNEGNQGLSSSLPPLHIITASADKIVPTFEDAMRQVRLLARSATGQSITTYTSFLTGPTEGHELHIVLVDNGRTKMAAQPEEAEALRCIRCGACANVCPAYAVVGGHAFGHVYTGPIGLITTAFHHGLDAAAGPQSLCLSCGACATVCPVDIPLPDQILSVRRRVTESGRTSRLRRLALRAYASRRLFAAGVGIAGVVTTPFRRGRFTRLPWLPAKFRWRTPPSIPVRPARSRSELRGASDAGGTRRASLLIQCITDRLLPEVAVGAVRVLRASGVEVDVPRAQHCCGLPAFDGGDWEIARRLARATIEAFEGTGDVVTPAPSCAAAIRYDYEHLFTDDPEWLERARALAARTYDLAAYLDGPAPPNADAFTASDEAVAVHRFCQSQTRMGAGDRVDRLLSGLCGVDARPIEGGVCCGFGGQTSMVAPEMSELVLERKLGAAGETGADVIVTDNPGCLIHLRGGADAKRMPFRVMHLAEYLASRLNE